MNSKSIASESRVKRTLQNARVNFIFYILILLLSFYSRRIFLESLGASFIGLTGTLNNLLGFLNLVELGVSGAIGFILYKPIFEQNYNKINELISILGYLYKIIGLFILSCGIILSFFLPLIFPEETTGFSLNLIYFAYYTFLCSSLIGYFINYKQILLGADQKNYIIVSIYQSINILKVIIQISLAYLTKSFYLWILIELVFSIIYSILLNNKIKSIYGWLSTDIKSGKSFLKKYPEIFKYVRQIFIQRICDFAHYQITPFLIYTFVSLPVVAFYGNYELLFSRTSQLIGKFLESTASSVGNLIAEGKKDKILKVFWELQCIRHILGGIIMFGFYTLSDAFISLWLGDEYIMSTSIIVLILLPTVFGMSGGCIQQFLAGYGLFYDVWASIAQTLIFLVTAIVGGHFFGLAGVLSGGVISYFIIMGVWKPYFLFNKGFKVSVINYWRNWTLYFILIAFSWIITSSFVLPLLPWNPSSSFIDWGIYALTSVTIYSIILATVFALTTEGTRTTIKRILKPIN